MARKKEVGTSLKGLLESSALESVRLDIEAFIGSTKITVGELQQLSGGSVITLDSKLNHTVDLRLNGVTIGRGELVAVDDNFAVRITEIAE